MEQKDIDKLLNSVNEEFFTIKAEEIEKIQPDISPDPSLTEIKQLLGELPSQIEYLKNKIVECKKVISDLKLTIKYKKQVLEREKSKIRQETLKNYQIELKKFFRKFNEKFHDIGKEDEKNSQGKTTKSSFSKTALQEMIKNLKPEKPTKNDLDDIANIETEIIQDEIVELEKKLIELEKYSDLLQTRAEKYENKFISARAHKGILVEELKNNI